jgi:hypothetical protein
MLRRSGLILVATILSACGLAELSPEPVTSPAPSSEGAAASAIAASEQPTGRDCPGLDVTLSELIALGRGGAGPDCFGNSPLTLRGWVWEDLGAYDCAPDTAPGDPLPPEWLYCTATHHARLTTVPYPPGEPFPGYIHPEDGPFFFAVDPASPAADVVRPNQWVEIVGLFDDPVTALCELAPDPTFREECMSTFVVREARVIEAP